jgi:TonB family protein
VRATRAVATLAVALVLGAASVPLARAESLDLDRWDEFMAAGKTAILSTLAPRDTLGLDLADVRWLADATRARGPLRPLDRKALARVRRTLDLAIGEPAPCTVTGRRWGALGGEMQVPLLTMPLDGQTLRVAFLPHEHAAVFALDGELQGCARLDLAAAPWPELLVLPPVAAADTLPPAFVDELAHPLVQIAPERGSDARAMGLGGTVRVKARIGVDGTVREATALDGPGLLHPSAEACVRLWRFEPARFEGRPVASWVVVPLRFE